MICHAPHSQTFMHRYAFITCGQTYYCIDSLAEYSCHQGCPFLLAKYIFSLIYFTLTLSDHRRSTINNADLYIERENPFPYSFIHSTLRYAFTDTATNVQWLKAPGISRWMSSINPLTFDLWPALFGSNASLQTTNSINSTTSRSNINTQRYIPTNSPHFYLSPTSYKSNIKNNITSHSIWFLHI